jgi:hypothetical protein
MRQALKPHPDSPCAAAIQIDVEVARPRPGTVSLSYIVTGDVSGLRMPASSVPARADGLWEHTCFEAFLRAPSGSAYYEFNLAPSTRWAAYRFDDYRSGMRVADEIEAPRIDAQAADSNYTLHAELALDRLPDLPGDAAWRLGLSAVIKEASGDKSYWALAHPPGRPDFHHSDCFAQELPAAWRS